MALAIADYALIGNALLAEEHDPVGGRQLGNFTQAFSHVALVNSAHRLGPAPPK